MSWSDRYRYLRSRGSDLGGREYYSMILVILTMMTTADHWRLGEETKSFTSNEIKTFFHTQVLPTFIFENKFIDIVDTKFSVLQFVKTKASLNCQIANNDKLFTAIAFAFALYHVCECIVL